MVDIVRSYVTNEIQTLSALFVVASYGLNKILNTHTPKKPSKIASNEVKQRSSFFLLSKEYKLSEKFCFLAFCLEIAFIITCLITRCYDFWYKYTYGIRDYLIVNCVGLMWGIIWVAISQVIVISYYMFLRFLWNKKNGFIQLRKIPQENFLNELKSHITKPESFLLLVGYLSLTWIFHLIPNSYIYDYYDTPYVYKVVLQLLLVDFFTYVNHIVEHNINYIYINSHKSHHRYINPILLNAFNGSVNDTVFLILFPLYATSNIIHLNTWEYVMFGVSYNSWFMLIHCEYDNVLNYYLSKYLLIYTAPDHHVHHSCFNFNYAHFFNLYDKFFGTYKAPDSVNFFAAANK